MSNSMSSELRKRDALPWPDVPRCCASPGDRPHPCVVGALDVGPAVPGVWARPRTVRCRRPPTPSGAFSPSRAPAGRTVVCGVTVIAATIADQARRRCLTTMRRASFCWSGAGQVTPALLARFAASLSQMSVGPAGPGVRLDGLRTCRSVSLVGLGIFVQRNDVLCRRHLRRDRYPRAEALPRTHEGGPVHVPCYSEPPDLVIASLDALDRLDYHDYEILVVEHTRTRRFGVRSMEHLRARFGSPDLPAPRALEDALARDGGRRPELVRRRPMPTTRSPRISWPPHGCRPPDCPRSNSVGLPGRQLVPSKVFWNTRVSFPAEYRSRQRSQCAHLMGTMCLVRRSVLSEVGRLGRLVA